MASEFRKIKDESPSIGCVYSLPIAGVAAFIKPASEAYARYFFEAVTHELEGFRLFETLHERLNIIHVLQSLWLATYEHQNATADSADLIAFLDQCRVCDLSLEGLERATAHATSRMLLRVDALENFSEPVPAVQQSMDTVRPAVLEASQRFGRELISLWQACSSAHRIGTGSANVFRDVRSLLQKLDSALNDVQQVYASRKSIARQPLDSIQVDARRTEDSLRKISAAASGLTQANNEASAAVTENMRVQDSRIDHFFAVSGRLEAALASAGDMADEVCSRAVALDRSSRSSDDDSRAVSVLVAELRSLAKQLDEVCDESSERADQLALEKETETDRVADLHAYIGGCEHVAQNFNLAVTLQTTAVSQIVEHIAATKSGQPSSLKPCDRQGGSCGCVACLTREIETLCRDSAGLQ
jgi:hypothetical protein